LKGLNHPPGSKKRSPISIFFNQAILAGEPFIAKQNHKTKGSK